MSFFDRNTAQQVITQSHRDKKYLSVWAIAGLSFGVLSLSFYFLCVRAPKEFPVQKMLAVRHNASLNEIAGDLYQQKIIQSPFWFKVAVIAGAGDKGVRAGEYLFKTRIGVFAIASRLTEGAFGVAPVKVTLPEGLTAKQMGAILSNQLIDFDVVTFETLAKAKEGYLFPDTYLLPPNATPAEVVAILEANFEDKMKSIEGLIKNFKEPIKDVVIMASILEAEARTSETRKIISGILWKRLSIGMPLQVDAPFQYAIGKNTFQLTLNDLKFDSPYNTYKYKGLPPTAIGNPGLAALSDAVTPEKSTYFYYLSDVRGNMHYAVTHEEHVLNKEKYLK